MLLDPLDQEEKWVNKDPEVYKDNKESKEDQVFKDLLENVETKDHEV